MAKLSISVPDDLWNEVRSATAEKSPSQLIQEALADWLSSRTPAFATSSDVDSARLLAIAQKKRAEAADLYRRGYEVGLDLFETWPFEVLDVASGLDFDLERLVREHESEGGEDFYPDGNVWEDVLNADGWRQGKLFLLGRDRALRDAFAAVTQDVGEDPVTDGEES